MTPSNSAVPFWLADAPTVSTKREMRGGIFKIVSAQDSATGSVAFDDAVVNA